MSRADLEKLEKNRMKKIVRAHLLFLFLLVALITPVHASVTIQAVIGRDVHVAFDFDFKNNETIYRMIQEEKLINESTIPDIILDNLKQQNLTNVNCYTQPIVFDNSTLSIHIAFYLTGSDIVNVKVDTKSGIRTYQVRTEWRKFDVNITHEISLSFSKYFGLRISHSPPSPPSSPWQLINYTDHNGKIYRAYFCNYTDGHSFDPLCYFILPKTASNIHAVEDTIIFELPLSFEDSLLNSPFLILGALIGVNIAFFLYRKVRR